MAGRDRLAMLVRRHLDPSQVIGLGPALAAAAALDLDVIGLTAAFADRPGLLVLTSAELRFITADASEHASATLERLAVVEVTTWEGRPVLVVLAQDSRRTLFEVGDEAWTRAFAAFVSLALDDPGAAVVAVDRHPGAPSPSTGAVGTGSPPSRAARERLTDLDGLRRDGLLTDDEYSAQRAAIISQI